MNVLYNLPLRLKSLPRYLAKFECLIVQLYSKVIQSKMHKIIYLLPDIMFSTIYLLGMYRISAPAPAGPASGPLLEVRPRFGSGQSCGQIWPDLGQPFWGPTEL